MEDVQYEDILLQMPSEVSWDFEILAEIISPDTWNNFLDDDNREQLMSLLPTFPTDDLQEKTRSLEMFFMDMNFRFGTPLRQFHKLLQNGYFNPNVLKFRKMKERNNRKILRLQYCDYLHKNLEETIMRRQHFLDMMSSLPPDALPSHLPCPLPATECDCESPRHHTFLRASVEGRAKRRYGKEIRAIKMEAGAANCLSEDDGDCGDIEIGPSKKQRKQLCSLEGSLPPHLLPIKPTHSSGSLAKDAQLMYPGSKRLLELGDLDLQNMISSHVALGSNKRGVSALWQDSSHTSLSAVIARVANSGSKRLSPVFDSNPSTENKALHRHRIKKASTRDQGGKFADTKTLPFLEVKRETLSDDDIKS